MALGPSFGYHVQPTKCYIIAPTANHFAALEAFKDHSPNPAHSTECPVVSGSRFLGGFVGEAEPFAAWLNTKLVTWANSINTLAAIAHRYPQSAYCCLQKSLQHKWEFIQRVHLCPAASFQPLESCIANTFLPAFFGLPQAALPDRALTQMPIRHAGLALPNPATTVLFSHTASVNISKEITRALLLPITHPQPGESSSFSLSVHRQAVSDGKIQARITRVRNCDHQFAALQENLPLSAQRRLDRLRNTGAWLHAYPCLIEYTYLSAQEFRDALCLRYGMTPPICLAFAMVAPPLSQWSMHLIVRKAA
jgi:hypothetical protein